MGTYTYISIEVDAKRAIARLVAMKQRIHAFEPLFLYAKQILRLANAANFSANGLPSGSAWAPLSPEYRAWKALHFPGAPKMVRSGALFNSLVNLAGPENTIRPTSAEFGTNVEYAKFHQYGTTRMPRRKLVFDPIGFSKDLAQRSATYVAHGVTRAGLRK
jgi:phage gpG-like protein